MHTTMYHSAHKMSLTNIKKRAQFFLSVLEFEFHIKMSTPVLAVPTTGAAIPSYAGSFMICRVEEQEYEWIDG